jgi:outer membrane immunogenic protein
MTTLRMCATLAALCFSGGAFAADFPAPVFKAAPAAPVFDWSGFYVGANAGYAWGRSDVSVTAVDPNFIPPYQLYWPATGVASLRPDGFLGGVQAGYNVQAGHFLWGVEGDAQYMRLKASRDTGVIAGPFPLPGHNSQFQDSVSANNLFTLRLRSGIVAGPTLLYATGGLAMTRLEFSRFIGYLANTNNFANSVSSTRSGWTLGGGLEYATAANWTVKAEYLYADFGSVGLRGENSNGTFIDSNATLSTHIIRFGLNYRFSGPHAANY